MATAAEVDLAFRLLLGRPANPHELATWQNAATSQLRPALMATEAFHDALPADAVRMPPGRPAPAVVVDVDSTTADALLRRVQARWEQLGRDRPHWSTNARDDFLPDRIAAHRAEFAATGQHDLAELLATLVRHGITPADLPRACDYGCGVGRVTAAMAGCFAAVTGCDVSAPHLALARQTTGARVRYALVTSDGFGLHEPFDLWFSTLTLQHNPPPVIALILRRMFALLAPGGVAVFQVPTDRLGYGFDPASYLASAGEMLEVHVLPQPAVFAMAHEAGCVPLEVREDLLIWPPTRCTSNTFVFRKAA